MEATQQTVTKEEKNLLYDFVCWLAEYKKFAFATEVEGEMGREWAPMVGSYVRLFNEYQKFVETQGPARQVYGQYGWCPLEDLERDFPELD